MTTFELNVMFAESALASMKSAPDGAIAISGDAWAHGAMATLLRAEFLAAQAGVVPWFRDPETGALGVISVGAAREHMANAPEAVRTMYLGTHALIRRTHATAREWNGKTPALGAVEEIHDELGEPVTGTAILIALVVVAIAGILAGAWYFTRKTSIEVEGRNLRTTAVAFDLLELARAQFEKTGTIDPKLYEVFTELAKSERSSDWVPFAVGGGAVLLGLGYTLYREWHRKQAFAAYLERERVAYLHHLETPGGVAELERRARAARAEAGEEPR